MTHRDILLVIPLCELVKKSTHPRPVENACWQALWIWSLHSP
jgi:hypothetical protein